MAKRSASVALVLCTGVEPTLMATRKLLLEHAGHTVITATSERNLAFACEHYDFDVVVIGQVMSPQTKLTLAAIIRKKCPSSKILELCPLHKGRVLDDADSWLDVPADVPRELAERVGELAAERKGPKRTDSR
jgi:CheY-like chemotaxis protein